MDKKLSDMRSNLDILNQNIEQARSVKEDEGAIAEMEAAKLRLQKTFEDRKAVLADGPQ